MSVSTSSSHNEGGNVTSYMICGRNWTAKSLLRFLICIIFFNAIIATFYFIPFFSVKVPQVVPKYPEIHDTVEHRLFANLMGHKIDKKPFIANLAFGDSSFRESLKRSQLELANEMIDEPNFSFEKDSDSDFINHKTEISSTSVTTFDDSDTFSDNLQEIYGDNGSNAELDKIETEDEQLSADGLDVEIKLTTRGRKKTQQRLSDPEHPQYSLAFPRNVKPLHLLNWTTSTESSKYFQQIDNELAWVYSGFYDDRMEQAQVRIFSLARRNLTGKIYCHLYGRKGDYMINLMGRLKLMKDHHASSVAAMEISCPAPPSLMPSFVRLTFNPSSAPKLNNKIKIQYHSQRIRDFTVCFPPLHSSFNLSSQIVQTIELSRSLGADHFFVYNFSIASEVEVILRWYQSKGLMTIMPWPLPSLDSWYYGQVLAINDCLYRNMGKSQFVVMGDVDEVIVPHVHSSWKALLDNVVKHAWQRDDEFRILDLDMDGEAFRPGLSEEEEDYSPNRRKRSSRRRKRQTGNDDEDDFLDHINSEIQPSDINEVQFKSNIPDNTDNLSSDNDEKLLLKNSENLLQSEPILDEEELSTAKPLQFGSFSFRCAFFTFKYKPLESDNQKYIQTLNLSKAEKDLFFRLPACPMTHLMRTDEPFEHIDRSKMISRPELIVQGGIHRVISHIEGYRAAYVEPEVALLHHYRTYKLFECNTLDKAVLKFKDQFFRNMKLAMDKFSSLLLS